ncbi:MAG: LLM class flavin-dependent oxidoreductase [Steroidobacteraceae bacterium]
MARHVNFGLWYDFRNPRQWRIPFERLYAESLDQIAEAERLGFDSIWMTEHHFCDDGYTPSPMVLGGAIAARTKRLRIGTNLIVLPLHNPIRVAEDAATLSLITGGRFDLGVGVGYRELEFREFGRQVKHRPSLIEEAIEIIRRAWAGEKIGFSGKRFEFGDVRVTPVPEHIPKLYLGGMTEPAIARAARIADGFLSTGSIGHDIYLESLRRQGRSPEDGVVIAGSWAIVSDDPEREARAVGPHALYQCNQYIEWGAFGPPDTTPRFPDAQTALAQGLYELWDADQAVTEITRLLQACPQIRDLHFWARLPGESVAAGHRRVEYMAKHVLPKVRASL